MTSIYEERKCKIIYGSDITLVYKTQNYNTIKAKFVQ